MTTRVLTDTGEHTGVSVASITSREFGTGCHLVLIPRPPAHQPPAPFATVVDDAGEKVATLYYYEGELGDIRVVLGSGRVLG